MDGAEVISDAQHMVSIRVFSAIFTFQSFNTDTDGVYLEMVSILTFMMSITSKNI